MRMRAYIVIGGITRVHYLSPFHTHSLIPSLSRCCLCATISFICIIRVILSVVSFIFGYYYSFRQFCIPSNTRCRAVRGHTMRNFRFWHSVPSIFFRFFAFLLLLLFVTLMCICRQHWHHRRPRYIIKLPLSCLWYISIW